MTDHTHDPVPSTEDYDPRFLEWFRRMYSSKELERLFPKRCAVCGKEYPSFGAFVGSTTPKGEVFQDAASVMDRAFTMVYRHCTCSNTLVVTLTEEAFPMIDGMWDLLREEAEESGKDLKEVTKEFARQCDAFFLAAMETTDPVGT
ncbi:MAG: hypothetical protein AB1646_19845 [Thermodesulfobacteriota bacterium]